MRRFLAFVLLLALVACGATQQSEPAALPATQTPSPPTAPPVLAATHTPAIQSGPVHRAEGAGKWYPAEAHNLQAVVDGYVGQAQVKPLVGRLLAVIVPHAGYSYSGAVAGHAFRAMQQAECARRTVIVIGDTHTGSGSAQIAVWAAGMFETPLGAIPVDEEIAQALVAADPHMQFDRQAFRGEHPVENQLPFIQAVCPDAQIVPVVIRQPSLENAQLLANALLAAIEDAPAHDGILIVASTDLSHYHTYEEARQMDEVALQAIVSLDPQAVADSPRRCAELGLGGGNPLTMCSQGAVMTALVAARQMGADRATVLHYANSGDVPIGDRSQVVGYGAVALWQASGSSANQPADFALPAALSKPVEPLPLTQEAQEQLLALARDSARQFLTTETFPFFHSDDPALLQPLGAYVTYRNADGLRGCVGRLEGDRPAYLNVQYAAVAAALIDNRFPPVTPDELDELSLEITLLHPMHRVSDPSEIQIGRDGILMRVGEKDGALFLPQVPLDEGWDLETTLVHLCRKAGLADGAWQRADAQFYVFAGEWFGEQE